MERKKLRYNEVLWITICDGWSGSKYINIQCLYTLVRLFSSSRLVLLVHLTNDNILNIYLWVFITKYSGSMPICKMKLGVYLFKPQKKRDIRLFVFFRLVRLRKALCIQTYDDIFQRTYTVWKLYRWLVSCITECCEIKRFDMI